MGGEGGALTAQHQTAGCCGGGREKEEGWRLEKNVKGRRPPLFAVLNPTLSKACLVHHDLGWPPMHLASG